MIKVATGCCALCQIKGVDNTTTVEELMYAVNQLKLESNLMDFTGTPTNYGGQKAVFVITTPTEKQLAKNLKECGFKHTYTFSRRKGYPDGKLKHWMLGWD